MDVNRISSYQSLPQGVDAPAPMPVQSPQQVSAPAPSQEASAVEMHVQDRAEARSGGDALQRAVREINSSISMHDRHLSIRMHAATGRRMVTVYDSVTNDVLREIPPERVLDAHASMLEMVGLFMDTRG